MMRLIILLIGVLFSAGDLIGQQIEFDELGGPEGAYVDNVEINPLGHILVRQNGNLYRSKDNGDNWEEIFSVTTYPYDFRYTTHPNGDFYFVNRENQLMRLPPDHNEAFMTTDTIYRYDGINEVQIDDSGEIYILNGKDEILKSSDLGKTWNTIISLGGQANSAKGMKILKGDEHIYLMLNNSSSQTDYFRCKNDGSQLENIEQYPIVRTPNGVYYAFERWEGWFRTDDPIDSWDLIPGGNFNDPFSFRSDNIIDFYVKNDGEIIVAASGKGFFSSKDNGVTWQSLNLSVINPNWSVPLLTTTIRFNEVTNSFFVRLETGTTTNFFRISQDFSVWEPMVPELLPYNVNRIEEDSLGNLYIAIGNSFTRGYYKSEDKGATFSPYLIDNGLAILRLSIVEDQMLAIAENKFIYTSVDHGVTWEKRIEVDYNFSRFELISGYNNDYLISTNSSLYYSSTNGHSWIEIDIPNLLILPRLHSNGKIYAYNSLPDRIIEYDFLNTQWLELATLDNPNEIKITPNGDILVSNSLDWFISQNEGRSFHKIDIESIKNIIVSKAGAFVALTHRNDLFVSANQGLTWEHKGNTFNNVSYELKLITKNNHVIATDISRGLNPLRTNIPLLNENYIRGKVSFDENKNCLFDSSERGIPRVVLKAEGDVVYYSSTNAMGEFEFIVPEGDYVVSVATNSHLWKPCFPELTGTLVGVNQTLDLDFPMQAEIDCPKLKVDLATPIMRRCVEIPHYVYYSNEGTIGVDSPIVEITLDPRLEIKQATIPYTVQNGNSYLFSLDPIGALEEGDFSFKTIHPCDSIALGETICAKAHIYPDTICAPPDPLWSGASLEVTGVCENDSIRFNIKNVGGGDMAEDLNYIIIEDVVIMRVGDPFSLTSGEEFPVDPIPADGKTIHINVPQVAGHPGNSNPSVTIEGCGDMPHNLGLFNQFSQDDDDSFVDVECQEVIGSYDPNDKSAVPTGIDVAHKIQPNSTIEYLIRFQNTGTDTAFNVFIYDTLSQLLDVPTFTVGASSHDYEYSISGEGIVRFDFKNIMLPDSFINEPASNGFIKYKIAMQPDAALGETILNDADIYFDFNDPIYTNETYHLIDVPWVTVKTEETFVPDVEVNVYPNPFVEQATFDLKNAPFGEKQFRLFSLSGNAVTTQTFDSQQFVFQRGHLPKGIYFYEIKKGDMKIAVGKLVVQ